ncbi:MAG: PAS domain S-box protein, partial [Syntrophobacteraceae bacterium]|nr:PAS domain S-box protein [Syntrophobacteraceae bacterium]
FTAVLVNRTGEQLLGRRLPSVISSGELASYFQVYRAGTDELYPIEGMPVVRAMSGEYVSADDVEIRRPDGSRVRLEVFGAPMCDALGRLTGAVVIFQDITSRKRTEQALQESEERFRRAMEATSDGIWDWNVATGDVYYSPGYFRMLGYEPEEFPAKADTWLELIHPDDRERALDCNDACIRNESPVVHVEFRMRSRDGSWRWILGRGLATRRDAEGQALQMIGTHVDITVQNRVEEELRERKEEFCRQAEELEKMMDLAPVAIWVAHDPHCHSITCNRAARGLLGAAEGEKVSAGSARGQSVHQKCFLRQGRELTVEELLSEYASINGMEVLNEEMDVLLSSGRRITLLGSASPLREESGKVRGCIAAFMDITERKWSEERLRKSEERFRELPENNQEVFWVRTTDEILYISPAYEEIWGVSLRSLYEDPSSFIELVHPEDRGRRLNAYTAEMTGVAFFNEEYRIFRPDGDMRWIRARSFPILEEGMLVRTAGIAEDITARKEAEELLRIDRDLALGLGSAASLTEALELLLEACLRIDHLDCGAIYLVEREAETLRLLCHRGFSADFIERVSFFGLTSPQGRFALQGEPGYWSAPL